MIDKRLLLCKKEADVFYGIAMKCEPFDLDILTNGYAFPFATNIAFACELYLKFLIMKDSQNNVHEHDLLKLFKKMGIEDKNKIFEKIQEDQLYEFLNESKNTFVEWRYSFENAPTKTFYMTTFVMFVEELKKITDKYVGKY